MYGHKVISPGTEYLDPQVVRRRPTDMGTIFGHSQNDADIAVMPHVLDRPRYQGWLAGSSIDRAPGNLNDTLITRDRGVMFRRPYSQRPAQAWINPIDSGPIKDLPTTRFNRNIRPIVGGSNQEFEGNHTNLPTGQSQVGGQLAGRRKMNRGHQNRLSVQRYRGQSYSQTTQIIN